jgi:hypothetical protein
MYGHVGSWPIASELACLVLGNSGRAASQKEPEKYTFVVRCRCAIARAHSLGDADASALAGKSGAQARNRSPSKIFFISSLAAPAVSFCPPLELDFSRKTRSPCRLRKDAPGTRHCTPKFANMTSIGGNENS